MPVLLDKLQHFRFHQHRRNKPVPSPQSARPGGSGGCRHQQFLLSIKPTVQIVLRARGANEARVPRAPVLLHGVRRLPVHLLGVALLAVLLQPLAEDPHPVHEVRARAAAEALAHQRVDGDEEIPLADEGHDRDAPLEVRLQEVGVAVGDPHGPRVPVKNGDRPDVLEAVLVDHVEVEEEPAERGPVDAERGGQAHGGGPDANALEGLVDVVVREKPPLLLDVVDVLEALLHEVPIHLVEALPLISLLRP
mmetsp:Transcript_87231/g.247313  ORF Transcript_87231/g.247313 Transcript_87231/m.247313 type:complete len:250 (-) Transcript_87231:959-1708(-)